MDLENSKSLKFLSAKQKLHQGKLYQINCLNQMKSAWTGWIDFDTRSKSQCEVVASQLLFCLSSICKFLILCHTLCHSFVHSGYFYSASSSPLLLRDAPDYSIDTVSELTRRSALVSTHTESQQLILSRGA